MAYVLARYDNVSQVQQDLESGKLVPVINAKLEGMVRQLYNSSTAGLHFNMWDSNYKSLVSNDALPASMLPADLQPARDLIASMACHSAAACSWAASTESAHSSVWCTENLSGIFACPAVIAQCVAVHVLRKLNHPDRNGLGNASTHCGHYACLK